MGQTAGGRFVRWRDMHRRAAAILSQLEVDIDPRSVASRLTVGAQQAVEIAKAMSRDVRVLIMDEPTAALSAHEVRRLFRQVRRLAASGVAILFVSHRLDEVFELSDRITVFRDGQHISTGPVVGRHRDVVDPRHGRAGAVRLLPPGAHEPGDVALSVEGLGREEPSRTSRSTSARARCSASPGWSARGVRRWRRRSSVSRPRRGDDHACRRTRREDRRRRRDAMRHGIAYVSEDRRRLGLSMPQSVTSNITLAGLSPVRRRGGDSSIAMPSGGQPTSYRQPPRDPHPVAVNTPVGQPVRRKPAEGDAGQVARPQPVGAHPRRADPWHRRGGEGRRARADRRARCRRRRGHPHLVGPPGGAGDERSRAGHARGPSDGHLRGRRISSRSGS